MTGITVSHLIIVAALGLMAPTFALAANGSGQSDVRQQVLETIELGVNTELARYLREEGKAQLLAQMNTWSLKKNAGHDSNWQSLYQTEAEIQARALLKKEVNLAIEKVIQQNTNAPTDFWAQIVRWIRSPISQQMILEDHLNGFVESLHPPAQAVTASERSIDQIPLLFQAPNGKSEATQSQDLIPGSMNIDWSSLRQLEQEKPSALRRRAAQLARTGWNFTVQSTLFNTASGLLQVAQLGLDHSTDPLALEHFEQSLTDPAMNVGFAAFMATNHQLTHLLRGVMTGKISRNLLPYIGMSAGLLASNLVSDLWHDQNLQKCVSTHGKDINSCDLSFENWVGGQKINQYAPAVISLCSSAVFAGAVTKVILTGRPVIRIAFRGLRYLPAAMERGVVAGSSAFGPEATLGSNLIFLAANSLVGSQLDPWMARLTTANFDLAEFLRDNTNLGFYEDGLHLLVFGNVKVPTAARKSTLTSALKNMRDSYQALQKNGWRQIPADSCGGELNCLTSRDLSASVEQYEKMNQIWRQTLLAKPLASEAAWKEALFNFSVLYIGSAEVYRAFIGSLHALANGQQIYMGQPIDLSAEGLSQILNKAVHIKSVKGRTPEEQDAVANLYPSVNGVVATPELLDYIITSMACGPRAEDGPSILQEIRSLSWVHHVVPFLYQNVPTPTSPVVDTPVGSALVFRPPNLTTLKSNICRIGPSSGAEGMVPKNIYEDHWYSQETGKSYSGVLALLADVARPDLVAPQGPTALINTWWDQKVTPLAKQAWAQFGQGYQIFMRRQLYPVLISRKMRMDSFCWGANEPTEGSGSNDPRDRLSCGVFHSMELELRQDLSVLRGLYLSSLKESDRPVAQQNFNQQAAQMIEIFRQHSSPQVLESSFVLEDANTPFGAVMNMLNDGINRDENDLRLTVAATISKSIQAIMKERAEYGRMVTIFDFEKQTFDDGPPAKANSNDLRQKFGH